MLELRLVPAPKVDEGSTLPDPPPDTFTIRVAFFSAAVGDYVRGTASDPEIRCGQRQAWRLGQRRRATDSSTW